MAPKLSLSICLLFVLAFVSSIACINTVDADAIRASSMPPANFTETTLVGTWEGGYLVGTSKDVITINADGTFVQELYNGTTAIYRSEIGHWFVEYRPSGCVHLYREGAKDFAEGMEKADELFLGTGGPMSEPCELSSISLKGQLILTIVENRNYPRGFWLLLPTADLDAGFLVFSPSATGATSTP